VTKPYTVCRIVTTIVDTEQKTNFYVSLTLHPNIMIDSRPFVTCVLNSHPKRVTIPDAVLTQLSS